MFGEMGRIEHSKDMNHPTRKYSVQRNRKTTIKRCVMSLM
jgi:hypothetical protein